MLELNIGDVVRVKSIKNFPLKYDEEGKEVGLISATFPAPKGKVLVALLLGIEDVNVSVENCLDIEKVLNSFGWFKEDE